MSQNKTTHCCVCYDDVSDGILSNNNIYCSKTCKNTHNPSSSLIGSFFRWFLSILGLCFVSDKINTVSDPKPIGFTCKYCNKTHADRIKDGECFENVWYCNSTCHQKEHTRNFFSSPSNTSVFPVNTTMRSIMPTSIKVGPYGAFTMYY